MDDRARPYWMYGVHRAHEAWWHDSAHVVLALLLIALVVLAVVLLIRRTSSPAVPPAGSVADGGSGRGTADPSSDAAVAELRMRYARGEIDREGYLQSFADLTGRAEPWPGQTTATADAPTAPATPPPPAPS